MGTIQPSLSVSLSLTHTYTLTTHAYIHAFIRSNLFGGWCVPFHVSACILRYCPSNRHMGRLLEGTLHTTFNAINDIIEII